MTYDFPIGWVSVPGGMWNEHPHPANKPLLAFALGVAHRESLRQLMTWLEDNQIESALGYREASRSVGGHNDGLLRVKYEIILSISNPKQAVLYQVRYGGEFQEFTNG